MKNNNLPFTIKEAALHYHKGNFKAFKNWIETHKLDHGRFTKYDALKVREEVKRLIMEEHKTTLAALEFQLDGQIDQYETFEMPSF